MVELIVQVACVAFAALLIYYRLGKVAKEIADVFLVIGESFQNGQIDQEERDKIWKEIEDVKQALKDREEADEEAPSDE